MCSVALRVLGLGDDCIDEQTPYSVLYSESGNKIGDYLLYVLEETGVRVIGVQVFAHSSDEFGMGDRRFGDETNNHCFGIKELE